MQQKLSVEEICQKLKPVFGKRIDGMYLRYAMAEGREEKEEIEHILNALYHKHLNELLNKRVLLEPPSDAEMKGEYPLAMISYAGKKICPFRLREHDWVRHVCISGMSGSGKTTLAFYIINNFIEKKKPFLIFDWKKSFRPLMLTDPEIMYFTIGNDAVSNFFKININKPPKNIQPREWLNVLCDLITESFFASFGVHKILLETLDEAFEENGIYNGSGRYPTWFEIKRRLEDKEQKSKGREASWIMSALRIAHLLTFGSFGKALNYKGKDALSIEELLGKKVVFELNALGNIEKKLFCEFILTYIYKLKKANQEGMNDKFEHAILVDEAHNVFLKERAHFSSETVTDMIYREMREYGTSLICLDQHISKISDTVAGNSACHVAFQQQLPQDIECISELMQMRDRKQFFSMLPVGSAVVKLSERYTQPFMIEIPPVALRNEVVTDEDVANRMKAVVTWMGLEKGNDPEFRKAMVAGGEDIKIEKEIEKVVEDRELKSEIAGMPSQMPRALTPITQSQIGEIARAIMKTESYAEEPGKAQKPLIQETPPLTPVQQVLFEYAEKKLSQGYDLMYIENVLERNTVSHGYNSMDVHKAINHAIEIKLASKKSVEFTDNQKVLHDYVKQKLQEGVHIETLKYMIKDFVDEKGFYSQEDIDKVIEHATDNDIRIVPEAPENPEKEKTSIVTTIEKRNIYKANNPLLNAHAKTSAGKTNIANAVDINDAGKEEENFISFLQANKGKDNSTVDVYKALGMSARKGNEIKNKLISKGIIKVEEARSNKGWKKIIKLN